MTTDSAESAVTTSAVIVGAVYFYRKMIEGNLQGAPSLASKTAGKQLLGSGSVPPLSHFLVGYGFAFMVIALMAQADPDIGGGMAVLLATSTIIVQGPQLFSDIQAQLQGKPKALDPNRNASVAGSVAGSALQNAGLGAAVGTGASSVLNPSFSTPFVTVQPPASPQPSVSGQQVQGTVTGGQVGRVILNPGGGY